MKKLLCVLLITAIVLSLAACGSKTGAPSGAQPANSNGTSQVQKPVPGENGWEAPGEDEPFGKYRSIDELLSILENGEGFDDAQMPSAEEREPVAFEQEDGDSAETYSGGTNTVTFSEDGWEDPSVEFVEIDVEVEEGGGQPGADPLTGGSSDWSASSYTAGLPEPPGALGMVGEEDGMFTAMATLSGENDYDAYVQSVKSAGFDKDIQEEDFSGYNMDMRSFSASHADGRTLILTLTGGSLIIEISR